MDLALLASALLLGLAGVPHCTAMCAAPCAAVTAGPRQGRRLRWAAFHGMRVLAYAAAGAVAASSVGVLGVLADWTPLLQPLWTLVHAAAFALGLWLLWRGRQPAWLENLTFSGDLRLRYEYRNENHRYVPGGPTPTRGTPAGCW